MNISLPELLSNVCVYALGIIEQVLGDCCGEWIWMCWDGSDLFLYGLDFCICIFWLLFFEKSDGV